MKDKRVLRLPSSKFLSHLNDTDEWLHVASNDSLAGHATSRRELSYSNSSIVIGAPRRTDSTWNFLPFFLSALSCVPLHFPTFGLCSVFLLHRKQPIRPVCHGTKKRREEISLGFFVKCLGCARASNSMG